MDDNLHRAAKMAAVTSPSPASDTAFEGPRCGDFRGLNELLAADGRQQPSLAARQQTTLTMAWLAGVNGAPAPKVVDYQRFVLADPVVREVALTGVGQCALASWLRWDAAALKQCRAIAQQLASGVSIEAQLEQRVIAAWCDAHIGVGEPAPLLALASDGRSAGRSHIQVVATALAARQLGERGDRDAALDLARRAVRMAQTDRLPQEQYLAAITLARVRRQLGHPHLATRILQRLRACASPPWRRWTDWELALAEPSAVSPELTNSNVGDTSAATSDVAARALVRHWQALAETSPTHNSRAALEAALADWPPACADGLRVLALFDPDRAAPDETLAAWRAGTQQLPPYGLGALLGDDPCAYVLAGPDEPGRRIAQAALSQWPQHQRLAPSPMGKQRRVRLLLAVVALAPKQILTECEAFLQTYGFAYDRALHRDVFNVLVHRTRQALGERGQLERDDGHLRLVLSRPLAIADPRCDRVLADRVLRVMSRRGRAGAKEIAGALGVSLRNAQSALGSLVEDGACRRAKQGRRVEYAVEDTTFSEPTNTHYEVTVRSG